jgi:hypothetical protein
MREENKMKQSIVAIALILLYCGYYLTPPTTGKNEDDIEAFPCTVDTQIQFDKFLGAGNKFEKTDSVSMHTVTVWGIDNMIPEK